MCYGGLMGCRGSMRHWFTCRICGGWRDACVRCGAANPNAGKVRVQSRCEIEPCTCKRCVKCGGWNIVGLWHGLTRGEVCADCGTPVGST